ncbi:MoaD/ThiS family protein [Geminocystis sp. NIES-3709]|uniref:MoaD/ThiS family protein n=1 Tax=Geminocystis sp. NIES-3709 TaxID=1617448 RepID=UPI0005FCBF41|nr:MoaD/ThiS family protein [Geminocystis sp. NIES-3709]BAQ65182.1 molybdenum cofactor biosynthesis protein MoaD [Geminocystis sp. NIES-3709]
MNIKTNLITVKIKLFAIYQEIYQQPEITLEITANTKLKDILSIIEKQKPSIKSWKQITRLAVNLEFVNPEYCLHDGDEIALIPPVSGG